MAASRLLKNGLKVAKNNICNKVIFFDLKV